MDKDRQSSICSHGDNEVIIKKKKQLGLSTRMIWKGNNQHYQQLHTTAHILPKYTYIIISETNQHAVGIHQCTRSWYGKCPAASVQNRYIQATATDCMTGNRWSTVFQFVYCLFLVTARILNQLINHGPVMNHYWWLDQPSTEFLSSCFALVNRHELTMKHDQLAHG